MITFYMLFICGYLFQLPYFTFNSKEGGSILRSFQLPLISLGPTAFSSFLGSCNLSFFLNACKILNLHSCLETAIEHKYYNINKHLFFIQLCLRQQTLQNCETSSSPDYYHCLLGGRLDCRNISNIQTGVVIGVISHDRKRQKTEGSRRKRKKIHKQWVLFQRKNR